MSPRDRSLSVYFPPSGFAACCLLLMALLAPPASAQAVHAVPLALGSGLNSPLGVAVDSAGNVFVADGNVNQVKEITASSGYTTVNTLGSGFKYPFSVAVDSADNVFVADVENNAVKEILAAGGYTTVNTLASGFASPFGVAVDSADNVFVADSGNDAVKEILAAGGYVTVNTLGSGFNSSHGLTVDSAGNVYVADTSNNAVKQIVAAGGYTTVNTLGTFTSPFSVALDGAGNVYVDEYLNKDVKKLLAAGGYSTAVTVVGLNDDPNGTAVDATGSVYVAANFQTAILKYPSGQLQTTAVGGTSAVRTFQFAFDTGGQIGTPLVLTQGAPGLDFQDAGTGTCTTNGALHTYNPGDTCTVDVVFQPRYPGQRLGAMELTTTGGTVISTTPLSGTGTGPEVAFPTNSAISTLGSGLYGPSGVAVDGAGNLFVVDGNNNAVKEILAAGGYTTVNSIGSGFSGPFAVALDGAGNVYVADTGNNAVKEILAAGGYTTVNTLGSGFNTPRGVALDSAGNVFVADSGNSVAKEIVAAGGYASVITVASGFLEPFGVAVDSTGNVYIADTAYNVVRQLVAPTYGTINTIGTGFGIPTGLATDAAGNVYVADYGNNAVKEIVAAGGYSTVNTLGSGFYEPSGVGVDAAGNVYVAANGYLSNSTHVEKIDLHDAPSLSFASLAGATSSDPPQTVAVANIGNADLSFPVPSSGNNPSIGSDFSLNSGATDACPLVTASGSPGTIASGAFCNLVVSFATLHSGPLNESLILTDNNLNAGGPAYATHTISLSGTGPDATAAAVGVYPSPAAVGEAITLTATVSDSTNPATVALGSVTFTDKFGATVTNLNGGTPVALSKGKAVLTTVLSGVGSHTITANYSGPVGFLASSNNAALTLAATASGAHLTSPAAGSTLSGSSATFNWAGGVGVTEYVLWVGSNRNAHDIANVVLSSTATSTVVNSLPTNGESVYVTLNSLAGSTWVESSDTYLASGHGTAATITSPMNKSTLSGTGATFDWSGGIGISEYVLWVGSNSGAHDIANVVLPGTATSTAVSSLPTNGETVYVTLNSLNGSTWLKNSYSYIASGHGTAAAISTPANHSTFAGASATFNWSGGVGIDEYLLWVGTTAGTHNLANVVLPATASSTTLNTLPTNGENVYVTLNSLNGSTWLANSYSYIASGHGTAAAITSPANKSTLTGANVTFRWSGGVGISEYVLWVGTKAGAHDLANIALPGTASSANVSGLPTNGSTIYVTLNSQNGATYLVNSYTFTAAP